MENNNLVSECYVINDNETGFLYPVIYLKHPTNPKPNHFIWTFTNPFDAKNFIQREQGSLYQVSISNEPPSEDLEYIECK